MGYLILQDCKKLIQGDNLAAIIGSDYTLLDDAISAAVQEARSYLVQKYDCDREFISMLPWDRTKAYKAGNLVYLDALAYNNATSYVVNDLATYNGNVYICINAMTGNFNGSNWNQLGAQYAKFWVSFPQLEFQYTSVYAKGNKAWWNDKVYTCAIPTVIPTHVSQIQYNQIANIPQLNIAPDDLSLGSTYWGSGTSYSISAGTLPTDTTKWTAGDMRSAQMVMYCTDIALYILHTRIAPRNIPELRVKRYDDAIKWLKNAAKGDITADIPVLQPKQGRRIRFGSEVRKINNY